jgi:septal ring factor EnvC (AmiA/AmiB activator)
MAKGNFMTDQDPWRQQVERQLADLQYRVGQLESSIEETSSRQSQQSWDLQNIDRRLKNHTGKETKNRHG